MGKLHRPVNRLIETAEYLEREFRLQPSYIKKIL